MPSATDFLPSSMTEFMNFERTMSPNLGSGRISRFSGRRRRDIGLFLSLQLIRNLSGAYCFLFVIPAKAGIHLLLSGSRIKSGMTSAKPRSLGTLGAVLGARLPAVLDALRVEHAAKHVVADAGQVAHATAADQYDAVLLEVVALAGNVADHFPLVGQADLGHLAECRVRLLRGRRIDAGADSALLRVLLHRRDLGLGLLRFATLADQLVNRRHEALHLSLREAPAVTLLNRKSAEPTQPHGRLATRMLSNVQLLPGASKAVARTGAT